MGYNLDDTRKNLADVFETGLLSGTIQYFDTHEFVEIIDFFLDQNETVKAERAIKNALTQHPHSVAIQIRKADWLFETNMLEEAEEIIDDILEFEKDNPEANELKGDILIQRESQKEGILFLQRATLGTEDKGELYSKIGVELMQIEELELALKFFFKALDEDLFDESSLYNVTYCYEFLNQQDEAISFLQKYINKSPYSQVAWHQLGLQYKTQENFKRAIWAFDYATVVDDAFLGAFFEKAKCHEEIEEYEEAIAIYKKAQKMADPTAWAYHRLGDNYLKLEDAEQALVNYFNAIHEDPMHAGSWYKIALLYSLDSQVDRSLEYAERAVDIEYGNIEYSSYLARLYMRLSMFDKADRVYEDLILLEVDDADIWIEYSILLKHLELENDSIDVLLRSLSYFPENAEILYRLSGMLFGMDRDVEAVDFLREALTLDFDKKEILKMDYPLVYNNEVVQDMIFAFKHHDKFF
jgi:tetratricopeptide (TPR) repeat protein